VDGAAPSRDEDRLRVFCRRLKRLHAEARGPKIDSMLAGREKRLRLGRSQTYDVLAGRIKRPPPWDFVMRFVTECAAHAAAAGASLTVPVDIEWWRREYGKLASAGLDEAEEQEEAGHALPSADVPRDAWVTPNELPPDVSAFTGRRDELSELDERFGVYLGTPAAPVITVISGAGGVGKTALVVHWGHSHASKFADGCVYLDLHGFDSERPMPPAEALAAMLRRTGVPETSIPQSLADRTAAYRTRLHAKRLLVILDNAHDAEQVRPLLPGSASCFVVVTSRADLTGLVVRDGARRIGMDVLTPEEAEELLRALIGSRAEPGQREVVALAEACGRLPLALRIAAELAASRPATTLADLRAELLVEQHRLDYFETGDPRSAVRAVLSWSYQHLPDRLGGLFLLLGCHPGVTIDRYSVAVLADTSLRDADLLLSDLASLHLLESAGDGRWRMHDLQRAYVRELATSKLPPPDAHAALDRLSRYYAHAGRLAHSISYDDPLSDQPGEAGAGLPLPRFGSARDARRWLDSEADSLIALALQSTGAELPEAFSIALGRYLRETARYSDAIAVQAHVLAVSHANGHKVAEAAAAQHLGNIYRLLGRRDEAVAYLTRALALAEELHDQRMTVRIAGNLGIVCAVFDRYVEALGYMERVLQISRQVGDRRDEGKSLGNIGLLYARLGPLDEARAKHLEALAIFRELGDEFEEQAALADLGEVDLLQGRHHDALRHQQQALALSWEHRRPESEGDALRNIGVVYAGLNRLDEAVEYLSRALVIFRRIAARLGEGETLKDMGATYLRMGDPHRALSYLTQAEDIADQSDARALKASVLNSRGEAYLGLGRISDAAACHRSALGIAQQTRSRYQQARAHEGLARALTGKDHSEEARLHREEATRILTELGIPESLV
jgi:tetratricopeptide (TPR) repeat protein